ncbi:hypothetical protein [Couchioplanes caeruleus]|uniref:hypothetical protein n=1 Tax=Couchioplanes caeruleus TaxID=56438 RepID=UPI0023E04632|nr:hypothetical protein [Couchioplanes caeruleus]
MADVVRLLPRHWDGRRLLQFLAGLALIALAFATPALSAAPDAGTSETVVTTVDAPLDTSLGDRVLVPDTGPAQRAGSGSAPSGEQARAAAVAGLEARAAGETATASGDSGRTMSPDASRATTSDAPAFSSDAAGPAKLCDRGVPGLDGVAQRPYAGRAPPRA